MRVKNIKGTSDNTCICGSWLTHWENFSNSHLRNCCSEKSCKNRPEVGAHVKKVNSSDDNWYIVPLCNRHNRIDNHFELKLGMDSIKLVFSANKDETDYYKINYY